MSPFMPESGSTSPYFILAPFQTEYTGVSIHGATCQKIERLSSYSIAHKAGRDQRPPHSVLIRVTCASQSATALPLLRGLGLGSTELLKERLESSAERGIPLLQFSDQTPGYHSESSKQLRLIERADKRICERIGHGGGEAIDAAPVDGVLSQADAREGECVIAYPTDPVFCLPWLGALDARPGVEDVVPAEAAEVGDA